MEGIFFYTLGFSLANFYYLMDSLGFVFDYGFYTFDLEKSIEFSSISLD